MLMEVHGVDNRFTLDLEKIMMGRGERDWIYFLDFGSTF